MVTTGIGSREDRGSDIRVARLVTLAPPNLVAVYWIGDALYAKRKAGPSAPWSSPVLVFNGSYYGWGSFAASGRGTNVDILTTDEVGDLIYLRSKDSGSTFGAPVQLASPAPAGWASNLAVARGADGVVVAAWVDDAYLSLRLRASSDGGKSFAQPVVVLQGEYAPTWALAITGGTIHLVYISSIDPHANDGLGAAQLVYRRSTDLGATWTPGTTIADTTSQDLGWNSPISFAARGDTLYVATGPNFWSYAAGIKIFRSMDGGQTWSRHFRYPGYAYDPHITLYQGVVRLAHATCTLIVNHGEGHYCAKTQIEFRKLDDAGNWQMIDIPVVLRSERQLALLGLSTTDPTLLYYDPIADAVYSKIRAQ